jgi:hypothetical protein
MAPVTSIPVNAAAILAVPAGRLPDQFHFRQSRPSGVALELLDNQLIYP